jgi:regulator of replication initiation timing
MISEFQDLSAKIEQLAALVGSLRQENAQLRQTNVMLNEVNTALLERLVEAQRRIEAVIEQLPAPAGSEPDAEDEAEEDAAPLDTEASR